MKSAFLGALAALVLIPGTASGQNREISLEWLRNAGSRYDGSVDFAGRTVSAAGDVNGDDVDDFLVAAYDTPLFSDPGTVYLVYGGYPLPDTDDLTAADVVISGTQLRSETGASLAAAGDVDDDGFDDFLIGAPRYDANGTDSGRVYLIYGSNSLPSTIDLGSLSPGEATVFEGEALSDLAGSAVAGVGFVDNDAFADILIGARGSSANGSFSGQAYLVYGGASLGDTVQLSGLSSSTGVYLPGAGVDDNAGNAVSAAGDVDDDGRDDFIVGAEGADTSNGASSGECYIVYGGDSLPGTISLGSLGSAGATIPGESGGDALGASVSGGGDVNGDGFADVVIGADDYDVGAATNEGRSYIVYGSDSFGASIDLSSLGAGGVVLTGVDPQDCSGSSVAMGGDMNRDGLSDVLIGALNADPTNTSAGEAYLIHGSTSLPSTLDLDAIGHRGVQLNGVDAFERAGAAVAFLGGVNDDGFDAYAVGAPELSPGAGAGKVYVVDGACDFLQADGPTTNGSTFTFRIHGRQSNDWLMWLSGSIIDRPFESSKGPLWMPGSAAVVLVFAHDSNGQTSFPLTLPNDGSLNGITLYWQVFQKPAPLACSLTQLLAFTVDP